MKPDSKLQQLFFGLLLNAGMSRNSVAAILSACKGQVTAHTLASALQGLAEGGPERCVAYALQIRKKLPSEHWLHTASEHLKRFEQEIRDNLNGAVE